jgi:hypothetical protein
MTSTSAPLKRAMAGVLDPKRVAARVGSRCPIPFGMAISSGRMCEPREVPLGKRCDCVCPACRAPLVSKHCLLGRRTPHFAHAHGADCAGAIETALHLAAKQRIAERGEFWFPALSIRLEGTDMRGLTHRVTNELAPPGLRSLSAVVMEMPLATMRPDLIVQSTEFGSVMIEIAVTHFVDDVKLDKIAAVGMAAIEVDLSHLRSVDFTQLDAVLFAPNTCVHWLVQDRLQQRKKRLLSELQEHLDQVNEDAREALHAARTFSGHGPAQRSSRIRQQDPHWVREIDAGARATQRARNFANKSEAEKRVALCGWMGVAVLPAFLTARCRQVDAFGVADPAVWQSALFLGQIDVLPQGINKNFNVEDAFDWLHQRFRIDVSHQQNARRALEAYTAFLRAVGVLGPPERGAYPILVADLGALAATIVASQPGVDIDRELRWADEWEWPSGLQAKIILEAVGLPMPLEWRRRLMRLSYTVAKSPLSHFCETFANSFRIEIGRLIDYLVRAGYLRIGQCSDFDGHMHQRRRGAVT